MKRLNHILFNSSIEIVVVLFLNFMTKYAIRSGFYIFTIKNANINISTATSAPPRKAPLVPPNA